jgi:hypothetical protein
MQLFRSSPHYVTECGPIDLVAMPPAAKITVNGCGDLPAHEDAMTFKLPAYRNIALLLAAGVALAIGFSATQASSAEKKRYDDSGGHVNYGPAGPNSSYQQGPHTRIYVTKRSWLDAGVEVLPGDRKFTDYALPPAIGVQSFARENNNRPIDRQPTNPPADMGGYPQGFPLY